MKSTPDNSSLENHEVVMNQDQQLHCSENLDDESSPATTTTKIHEQSKVIDPNGNNSTSSDMIVDKQPPTTDETGTSPMVVTASTNFTAEAATTNNKNDNRPDNNLNSSNNNGKSYTMIAKYGKKVLTFDDLSGDVTIGEIKCMIQNETRILPKRQKLVGLQSAATTSSSSSASSKGMVPDELPIADLKIKPIPKGKTITKNEIGMEIIIHQFILMGTPEEEIFIDPVLRDDIPDVIDDFDFDYTAGSDEWYNHVANEDNLKKFTEQTPIHIMNDPRPGKPLLVLDLDHTLLDFSSRTLQRSDTGYNTNEIAESMKRPFMDDFLTTCYEYYDMVVWSQTSWRWLETKLIELGMVTNPNYKFCFVLDKTSMFTITSTPKKAGVGGSNNNNKKSITHHVKPLRIIWSKFNNRWGSHNTVHIDDLSRNFALNLQSGIKCKPYYRKKASSGRRDVELLGLSRYLVMLAQSNLPFDKVDFSIWSDVVSGIQPLQEEKSNDSNTSTNNQQHSNNNSKK